MIRGNRSRWYVALTLLSASAVGQWMIAGGVKQWRGKGEVELVKKLDEFPKELNGWSSTELPLDNETYVNAGRPDQYLQRTYVHPSGETVVLWMNYSVRSADQYHYPTVCMTGAGWEESEGRRELRRMADSLPDDRRSGAQDFPYVRLVFNRRGDVKHVYYWYYLLGEDPVDRTMRSMTTYARVFLRGRRSGSMTIEVFSQNEKPSEALLDEFTRDVARELKSFLPVGTDADCSLGACY